MLHKFFAHQKNIWVVQKERRQLIFYFEWKNVKKLSEKWPK